MIQQILNRKGGWVIGIAVALGLFVALNAGLSGVTGLRIDLTQDRPSRRTTVDTGDSGIRIRQ